MSSPVARRSSKPPQRRPPRGGSRGCSCARTGTRRGSRPGPARSPGPASRRPRPGSVGRSSSGPVTSSCSRSAVAHRARPTRPTTSSASHIATASLRAPAIPTLRRVPTPRRRSDASTRRTRGSRAAYRSTIARVASVEPLSTTTISHASSHSWASSASSWSSIVAAASRAGMTTLERGARACAVPVTARRPAADELARSSSAKRSTTRRGRPPRRAAWARAAATQLAVALRIVDHRTERLGPLVDRCLGGDEGAAGADGLAQRRQVAGEHRDAVRLRLEHDAGPPVEQERREQHAGVGVDAPGVRGRRPEHDVRQLGEAAARAPRGRRRRASTTRRTRSGRRVAPRRARPRRRARSVGTGFTNSTVSRVLSTRYRSSVTTDGIMTAGVPSAAAASA